MGRLFYTIRMFLRQDMARALQTVVVRWPRHLVQNIRGGKKLPRFAHRNSVAFTFSMKKISLPLHSQQALLTIGTYLKYSRVSISIQESAPGAQ